jgi:peroxiredoxin
MPGLDIGQEAPGFRLPSAEGPERGPDDFAGRNLILWFTKGMGCAFCRQHMSQLARIQGELRARGAEVLQVTPTPPARARFYAEQFRLPFVYLCDPDYRVHGAYGVTVRSHSLAWYVHTLRGARATPPPPTELGEAKPALRELPALMHDSDTAFFVLDRDRVVRYRMQDSYVMFADEAHRSATGIRPIPPNAEILRAVDGLAAA